LGTFGRLALLFALLWTALIGAAVFGWGQMRREVDERAAAEADRAVNSASLRLDEAEQLWGPIVRAEVRALRARAQLEGAPSLRASRGGEPPVLQFGRRPANGALVDGVADRAGGEAVLYASRPGAFALIDTSMTSQDGARALDGSIAADTEAYAALKAGRPFTGPIESHGQAFYAHLEPVQAASGKVIGVYGAQFPLTALDQISGELANSPIFARGFLAVEDRNGRVLYRSSNFSPALLERFFDSLSRGKRANGALAEGYHPVRSVTTKHGFNIVAVVYERDLTLQSVRLAGASLGALGFVIVLALCLAWLMARRLTEALDVARRSRAEAETARTAAEADRLALTSELDQAARYVESLLPKPSHEGPVATNWLYKPSVGVGGDAFGYHWADETHFSFYLLDVCGHGVGAALLATTVMNILAAKTMGGVDFTAPGAVLAALNDAFPMQAQNGMYFTIWYGVYETSTRTVSFAAAGHHAAVMIAPGAAPQLLQGKGLPIGCFDRVVYPVYTVKVVPGARLYVFSDGLFEVDLKGSPDMFTFEEFVNVIMEWRERYEHGDLQWVLEAVQDLQGKATFDDDCALMELEFNEAGEIEIAA
jgi:serine phosphatase RsbU (regulator of sigma subunit)